MSYSLRLISLKCLTAQEDGGDEIYLTMNGEKVWSVWGDYTMRDQLDSDFHIREVDFVGGRFYVQSGWKMIPGFIADGYHFVAQNSEATLELWDADKFRRDELFGKILVNEGDSDKGPIQGVAALGGAHYVLTYRVASETF